MEWAPFHDRVPAFVAFACYALCCITFISVVTRFRNFWDLSHEHGDNAGYLTIAQAARQGRFSGPDLEDTRRLYRGTGYGVALVSKLTTLPVGRCLPLVALACGALAVFFCGQLWGWRVAALFAFIDVAYTQRVCLGGCEPIFIVFLFASMWLWRKQHVLAAVTCACLAVCTRPTGVFLLFVIIAVLAWQRRWKEVMRSVALAVAIGALYLMPFFLQGDLMAPANGYAADWYNASPLTFPFYPLLRAALTGGTYWTNHLKNGFYVALTIFGVVTLWQRRREAFADLSSQVESTFFLVYALFCVSYNSPWAYADYPRFSSPLIPQSVIGLPSRLLNAWVLLPMSVLAGFLSGVSALNVRTVFDMLAR